MELSTLEQLTQTYEKRYISCILREVCAPKRTRIGDGEFRTVQNELKNERH